MALGYTLPLNCPLSNIGQITQEICQACAKEATIDAVCTMKFVFDIVEKGCTSSGTNNYLI